MSVPTSYDVGQVILPTRAELFGQAIEIQPISFLLVVATIPFLLGLAGSRQRILALALYAQHVLLVCLLHAFTLDAAGILPSNEPIPFPLGFLGQVLAWSVPFFAAGYFAPGVLRKVRFFRARDRTAPKHER